MVAASSSTSLEGKLPTTSSQLFKFLETFELNDYNVRHQLMPVLEGLAQTGSKGEGILAAATMSNDPLAKFMEDSVDPREIEGKTIELVYMLSARLSLQPSDKTHSTKAMTLAKNLAAKCNTELLSYACPRLGLLATGIIDLAVYLGQPGMAMRPLEDLMARLPHHSLSGVHAAYLEVCLITRNYEPALQVINMTVLEVHRTLPSYAQVLTFYHHAGLICAALKDWRKAREMFEVCLVLPGHAVSAIQISAAKRAILCEILWSGRSYSFPRQTSNAVHRAMENKIYNPIRDAFSSSRWSDVEKLVRQDLARGTESMLAADDNVGLVYQVLAAIPKRKIWRLTQTYSRMSLADVAVQIGYKGKKKEVESMLVDMINDERCPLGAEISDHFSSAGRIRIVAFGKAISSTTAASQARQVEQLNRLSSWWETVLANRAKQLGLDPKWLKKQASRLESTQHPAELAMGGASEDLMPKKGVRGAGADWNDAGF